MIELTAAQPAQAEHSSTCGKRSKARWALGLVTIALAAIFLPQALRVTLGSNFHAVVEQRLYRAAQPSGSTLEHYVRNYGIRTVINLRGPNNKGEDWFEEEQQAVRRCQVNFVSVNMSASDKPQEQELRNLINTFDQLPEPFLVHCNSGSDRSGFASACFLLLKTDTDVQQARGQLSLRFGHLAWGKARCLSQVLDQYQEWLDAEGLDHQPNHFRHWARLVYEKDDWPEDFKAFGK